MLWFGLRKAVRELQDRVRVLEIEHPARIAALENAADLYNRAAARAERTKVPAPDDRATGILALRAMRGDPLTVKGG